MHIQAIAIAKGSQVVRDVAIDPDGANGRYVSIAGRKGGIVAWFLTLIGIDDHQLFEVYGDRIVQRTSSLSGTMTTVYPLSAVSATCTGYFKPVLYLVLGLATLMFGIGILFIIMYFLNEKRDDGAPPERTTPASAHTGTVIPC